MVFNMKMIFFYKNTLIPYLFTKNNLLFDFIKRIY